MSNELEPTKNDQQNPSQLKPLPDKGLACQTQGSGWLKGSVTMAICCAAPLLLVAAIAFFGLSVGAIASGALSLVALLACPVGMFLMMRMMMKNKE
jgi:hypothetical protein